MYIFGQRVKELREEKGLSQEALAELLQVSKGIISYWETGKSEPKGNSLIKVAKFFGVTTDYLLGLEN